jgi:hypothetical protein
VLRWVHRRSPYVHSHSRTGTQSPAVSTPWSFRNVSCDTRAHQRCTPTIVTPTTKSKGALAPTLSPLMHKTIIQFFCFCFLLQGNPHHEIPMKRKEIRILNRSSSGRRLYRDARFSTRPKWNRIRFRAGAAQDSRSLAVEAPWSGLGGDAPKYQ